MVMPNSDRVSKALDLLRDGLEPKCEETWSGFFGGLDARFKPVLAFAALILLLLYRPQGLFGKARVL